MGQGTSDVGGRRLAVFSLPAWLLIIPVLGFLVFIHELGHFLTAKWFRIKVNEFAFGLPFPPRLVGVTWRGTMYSIYWVPFGGFVRLLGEEDPTHPDSFARQSVWKRAAVLVAGSFMNLLLPVVVFTVLFMLPHTTVLGGDILVTAVAPGSPAEESGLRAGDRILSVDGERVLTTGELIGLVRDRAGERIELNIMRGATVAGMPSSPEFMTFDTVTVVPREEPPRLTVVEAVTDPTNQVSLADANRYDRGLSIGDRMDQGAIGVRISLVSLKFGEVTEPVWEAVPSSVSTIWNVLVLTWDGIFEGVSTRTNPGIAGPVGIAHATEEVVDEFGISLIFQLAALLSISLGVLNLLPFPALDGGRLMFVVIEWVRRGKRISPQREGLVHLVGFAILITLIIVITYSDITRILNGESFLR